MIPGRLKHPIMNQPPFDAIIVAKVFIKSFSIFITSPEEFPSPEHTLTTTKSLE